MNFCNPPAPPPHITLALHTDGIIIKSLRIKAGGISWRGRPTDPRFFTMISARTDLILH